MPNKCKLFASVLFLILFLALTLAAKFNLTERIDFDLTVKLQNVLSDKQRLALLLPKLLVLADPIVTSILVLITACIFWRQSILIIICFIALTGVEIYGKYELQHPPPPHFFALRYADAPVPKYYVRSESSYPSGHAARSIYLVAIWSLYLLSQVKSLNLKTIIFLTIIASLGSLAFLIGLIKVYLGEHWTSDVLGGWLLGLGLAFIASIKLKLKT